MSIVMKFKDAPIGARFKFIDNRPQKNMYVKVHDQSEGLIVRWNGNIKGHQSHYRWVDKENKYDFNTEILVL